MDAFESIIATILEREGWWVHRSFKAKSGYTNNEAIIAVKILKKQV